MNFNISRSLDLDSGIGDNKLIDIMINSIIDNHKNISEINNLLKINCDINIYEKELTGDQDFFRVTNNFQNSFIRNNFKENINEKINFIENEKVKETFLNVLSTEESINRIKDDALYDRYLLGIDNDQLFFFSKEVSVNQSPQEIRISNQNNSSIINLNNEIILGLNDIGFFRNKSAFINEFNSSLKYSRVEESDIVTFSIITELI